MARGDLPADESRAIILGPDRAKDIGAIAPDAVVSVQMPSGPIRLLYGYPGPKGFGLQHLTTVQSRAKDIAGLGYPSCKSFVFEVAAGWTSLRQGHNGRLIAVLPKKGLELAIVLGWSDAFWSVVTAYPARAVDYPVVFERLTV